MTPTRWSSHPQIADQNGSSGCLFECSDDKYYRGFDRWSTDSYVGNRVLKDQGRGCTAAARTQCVDHRIKIAGPTTNASRGSSTTPEPYWYGVCDACTITWRMYRVANSVNWYAHYTSRRYHTPQVGSRGPGTWACLRSVLGNCANFLHPTIVG